MPPVLNKKLKVHTETKHHQYYSLTHFHVEDAGASPFQIYASPYVGTSL